MFFPLAVNLHGKSMATSLSLALNLRFTFTFITSTSVGEVWQLFSDSVFQKSFFNVLETKPTFDLTLKWNELINKFDYQVNITRTELDFLLFFLKSLLAGCWVRATVWIELGYCKLGYFNYNISQSSLLMLPQLQLVSFISQGRSLQFIQTINWNMSSRWLWQLITVTYVKGHSNYLCSLLQPWFHLILALLSLSMSRWCEKQNETKKVPLVRTQPPSPGGHRLQFSGPPGRTVVDKDTFLLITPQWIKEDLEAIISRWKNNPVWF